MRVDAEETGRVADLAAEINGLLAPPPARERWPSVSAIVPTHDGRELLGTLLSGLADGTDYPALEVVIVDNASSDGTVEWLESMAVPFPMIIVRNARNLSFSAAMNVGAARSSGELLLFLNNDIQPIERGWLCRLVTSLEGPGTAIAGAVLVDPNRTSVTGRPIAVQHDGIAFRLDRGVLRPVLRGLGGDVAEIIGPDGAVAAVAAACALTRRREFEEVGGFDERYRYGGEDIDLCLRLARRGGTITMSRTTVLLHRPLSTRRGSPDGAGDAIRANHTLLLERWGPALRREYALDVPAVDVPGSERIWNGDAGEADAGVSYCVKPGAGTPEGEVGELLEQIEAAGHSAHVADGTDTWLLDDVVVHLFDGHGRHAVTPGRLNVLLCSSGAPPAGEASAYDLVVGEPSSAAELIAAADAALAQRGGPRRAGAPVSPDRPTGPERPVRRVVVVLGMARTGTSVTMRMLNILGVDVGEPDSLLAAIDNINERGFFEHYAMMRLNTALLRRLGGSWRDPPPLAPGWESDPSLDDLREQAAGILREEFAHQPLWGFKDPRTCLTLPFWRPLIGSATFVICHRHPLEIAASLERRDGLTIEQSIALWRLYTGYAIAATADDPRMFVGYRTLLSDPFAACQDLAAFLDAPERAADPDVRREIERWVEPNLRHHDGTARDLFEDSRLGPHDVSLALLLDLATGGRSSDGDQYADALNAAAARVLESIATTPVAADG